jgi:dipeptidyl aminopeptidase/acylaminoacyl peptidase
MTPFRRATQLMLLLLGVVAGVITFVAGYMARMMIRPPRQRLWATPDELGMPYEQVQFPAHDGLRLSGWFVPTRSENGQSPKATLLLVHGWPWNRLGTAAESLLVDLAGSAPVQLMHLALALHRRGYQLLMFDLRNHGQSAASAPVTFGWREADDLLGALDYVAGRDDVDAGRIGVIGFSMGANATLFSLPRTDLVGAAVAVQPTSPTVFASRYSTAVIGPLSRLVIPLVEFIYRLAGGLSFSAMEPIFASSGSGQTPLLFVQGTGDNWGSAANVAAMVAASPTSVDPIFVKTNGRFGGYQYVIDNPEMVDAFFSGHLP